MRYPVLLFDLFRTIVRFTPHAPTGQVKEQTWRPAMNELRGRAQAVLGPVPFDFFLDALFDVSLAIAKARPPEHRETPIAERYRRALARLGLADEGLATAEQLAQLQLDAQAANSEVPSEHLTLLHHLARTRRLAVISNFDHAPTAHALLARHGLDTVFSAAVISIEVNRRKPHPEVFHAALQRLAARPDEALMVGDNLADDVGGAAGVGIDTAWVSWGDHAAAPDGPRPTYTLRALVDLREVLAS